MSLPFIIWIVALLALQLLFGVVVGWSAHRQQSKTVRKSPEGESSEELDRIKKGLASLQQLTTGVSKDIETHTTRINASNHELSDIQEEGGQSEPVDAVVATMLEANDDIQKRLALAERKIAEQLTELRQQSTEARTDALTGLLNRRGFDEESKRCSEEQTPHSKPTSFFILDIDHFKNFNDQYGHDIGDEVLRETAKVVSLSLRPGDIATRFGGEEFVVILPESELEEANRVAEKIRIAIAENRVDISGEMLEVRVSIGVAQGGEETTERLLKRADTALYAAKEAGRNRTYYHDGEACLPVLKETETPEAETPETDVEELDDEITTSVVAEPEVQEPEVQEPEVQEPEVQEPEVQEPEVQEPEIQEPEVQEPEVQEPEVQEPEVQEPEVLGSADQDKRQQELRASELESQLETVSEPEPPAPNAPSTEFQSDAASEPTPQEDAPPQLEPQKSDALAVKPQDANLLEPPEQPKPVDPAIARCDALTGLPSHVALSEEMSRCISEGKREGSLLSLVLCNVDGMQAIAEEHGERAAELLTIAIGQFLSKISNGNEIVTRSQTGGFAMLMPGRESEETNRVVQKIQHAVESAVLPLENCDLRLTLEPGVAHMNPDDDASTLLRRAQKEANASTSKQTPQPRAIAGLQSPVTDVQPEAATAATPSRFADISSGPDAAALQPNAPV